VIDNLLHPFLKPERRFLCLKLLMNVLTVPDAVLIHTPGVMIQIGDSYNVIVVGIQSVKDNLFPADQNELKSIPQCLVLSVAAE
jgi:hypothetical protein